MNKQASCDILTGITEVANIQHTKALD